MDKFFEKYPLLKGSIPYFIIGGVSTVAELVIFFMVKKCGVDIYYANIAGKMSGLTLSFTLNSLLNFKVKDAILLRLLLFYGVGIGGLVFSNIILFLGVEKLCLSDDLVKLVSLPVVGFFQFLINKFVTFSSMKTEKKRREG